MTAAWRAGGRARVLVIGYGNVLRTDDGVGPHAARLLADDPRLAGAAVLARHQLAPELAADVAGAALVILVDATTATPPGAVTVRPLAAAAGPGGPATGPGATSHHVGPELLLGLASELYGAAPEAVAVSVGVANMGPGETLSPRVAAALPAVADAVARLVAEHEGRAGGGHREPA